MNLPALCAKLMGRVRLAREFPRLPVADLRFDQRLHREDIRPAHANVTRRHPRYKVFRNKTMGIALIDLSAFAGDTAAYLSTVRAPGHAGPQGRKASARGY